MIDHDPRVLLAHAPFWKELRVAESIGGHDHGRGRVAQTGPQAEWSGMDLLGAILTTLQQPAHRRLQTCDLPAPPSSCRR